MAVPFALTGGVYLLWVLGYNFSVAVWVGFIALFGTAVQTAVVMVIYLEEAVHEQQAKRGRQLTTKELDGGRDRGSFAQAKPKGDDRFDGGRRTSSDHVEHKRRIGDNEATCDSGPWRNGFEPAARADHNASYFLLVARAGVKARC